MALILFMVSLSIVIIAHISSLHIGQLSKPTVQNVLSGHTDMFKGITAPPLLQ